MNRRTFLRQTTVGTAAVALGASAGCVANKQPAIPDRATLASARDRIVARRAGNGTIRVRDANGRAIRKAKVHVEQLRHDFLFGSNFFMFGRYGEPKLEEEYRRRFAALLNFATLGFYWGDYERQPGQPNYAYTDRVVAYCREQGITCKGHPLVWDHDVSTPSWLPKDLKQVEKLSKTRAAEIVARYKGQINTWDVVNEATHLYEKKQKTTVNEFGRAMGQVPYVTEHLRAARDANPGAVLIVNDYKTGPNYYALLDKLRSGQSLVFDVVGIQSHMHRGVWSFEKIWEVCDTFAQLGLPIHFTETTVVSGNRGDGGTWGPTTPEGEAKQADDVVNFYTALLAHPAVEAITWWDFSDHGAWQGAPAGWLRNDMSPKPVYDRLMSLIKGEWWTNFQAHTNSFGAFSLNAFYGVHRLTVTLPNGHQVTKEFPWHRGETTSIEVTI